MEEPSSSNDDQDKMEESLRNEDELRKKEMDELFARSEERGEINVRLLNEENRALGRVLNAGYSEEGLHDEEFRMWKNNAMFLYDLTLTTELDWPSLTVQWLPDRHEPAGKKYSSQTLIVGTRTAAGEYDQPNFLKFIEVRLPLIEESDIDPREWSDEVGAFGTIGSTDGRFRHIHKITHAGEVHRARYMPQNIFLIATKTVSSEVYIFDSTRHPIFEAQCNPDIRLFGHTGEGYALSWNKLKEGHLLSGSYDSKICRWDINAKTTSNRAIVAMQTFQTHHTLVEDVAWHSTNPELFGSVGNDHQLLIWDARRAAQEGACIHAIEAHLASVNSLAFSPFNENMLATGSEDGSVAVFDVRYLKRRLHLLSENANGEIVHVEWSPLKQNILASGGDDGRVGVWDINRIGQNKLGDVDDLPPELKKLLEAEKYDQPELIFIHGGHTSEISDFSWNPSEDSMIASVEQGNLLEVWQMRDFDEEELYGFVDDMTSLRTQSETGRVDDMTSIALQSETGPADDTTRPSLQSETGPVDDTTRPSLQSETGPVYEKICGFNSYEPDL